GRRPGLPRRAGGTSGARPRRGLQRRPDLGELPDPRRRGDRRGGRRGQHDHPRRHRRPGPAQLPGELRQDRRRPARLPAHLDGAGGHRGAPRRLPARGARARRPGGGAAHAHPHDPAAAARGAARPRPPVGGRGRARGGPMTAVTACRSCGGTDLQRFLDLGTTPLPDALVDPGADLSQEERFPLGVAFCPSCSLVQLTEEVSAEKMFVDNYHYYSSFSDHLLKHSREHALGLVRSRGLGPDSLVVEVASNDGYLLRNFVEVGVPVLGIDPSPGPAAAAVAAGVPTLREFFGIDLARRLVAEGKRADVIIANNVMAHVPDLNGFVAGMKHLLADDGLITVENPYVRDLIDHCEFDTIYHEHFCYFSCTAVDALARRHGLWLNDVEYFPDLHGGTLRWHLGHHDRRTDTVRAYLREEAERGLTDVSAYADFADRVRR